MKKLGSKFRLANRCVLLAFALLFRRGKLVSQSGAIFVSLSSYGKRIRTSFLAVMSFAGQTKLIKGITLHLDEGVELGWVERYVLSRLKSLGVEVLESQKRGPHTKYFEFLHSIWDERSPIALIDDDVVYAEDLVDRLYASWRARPEDNHCVRSFQIGFRDGQLLPYSNWSPNFEISSSPSIFATNVGGVMLSPRFCSKLKSLGDDYLQHCEHADDIWFHWVALRAGISYHQVDGGFINPPVIPFTQSEALWRENLINSRNDSMIQQQYSQADINVIRFHERSID